MRTAVQLARIDNQMAYLAELEVSAKEVEAWAEAEKEKGKGHGKRGEEKKRKRGEDGDIDVEEEDSSSLSSWSEGKEQVTWREALAYFSSRGVTPEAYMEDQHGAKQKQNLNSYRRRYVPLMNRPKGRTYEETVADFTGKKQMVYEEHKQKREAGEKRGGDVQFFQRLRGELRDLDVKVAAAVAKVEEREEEERRDQKQVQEAQRQVQRQPRPQKKKEKERVLVSR